MISEYDHAINNGTHSESNVEVHDGCDIVQPDECGVVNTEHHDTQRSSEHNAEPIPEATTAPAMRPASVVAAIPAVPSTSALCPDAIPSSEDPESVDIALDESILAILGEDPTISNVYGPEIHKDLALRLEHFAQNGLSKDLRKELGEKYLLPSNCKLISAPALNAEIKAAIPDVNVKRDKNIETRQKQTATAISCLGQAINCLISKKDSNTDSSIVKMLMDAERILCDVQHNDSVVRRNFILTSLKKDMKDQLQNTKPDELLFGQNLSETIKTAKAIHKSGAELRTTVPKPQYNQANSKKPPAVASTSRALNWKGPYPARKPPNHPKTKEPTQSKSQPSTSSRHSQPRPTRGRR